MKISPENFNECVICLEIIENNNELKIPCDNCINIKYHNNCLNNYFTSSQLNGIIKCCQCRKDINIQNSINNNNTNINNDLVNNHHQEDRIIFNGLNTINFDIFFEDIQLYLHRFYQIRTLNTDNHIDDEQQNNLIYKIYFYSLFYLMFFDIFVMFIFSISNKKDYYGFIVAIIAFTFTSISLLIKRPIHYDRYIASFNEHCIFIASFIQWCTRFISSFIFIFYLFNTNYYGQFIEFITFTSSFFILLFSYIYNVFFKKTNIVNIVNEV